MQSSDKVSILFSEFERRKRSNASYSVRAYARDLGISHTLLSLLKSGKRELTPKLCAKISSRLNLNKKESSLFAAGLKESQKIAREKISLTKFAMISDWPYYAVLSLLDTQGFEWNAAWIAKRLGITENRAAFIMRGLIKTEMVEKKDGQYKQKSNPIVVENTRPHDSAKSFNRRLIQKATESMESTEFDQRDLSSIVFAMDPEHVGYAIERIRNFRRSLSRELELLGPAKEVYALAVQLFPLSKKEAKK